MRSTTKILACVLMAGSVTLSANLSFAAERRTTTEMTDQGEGVLKQVTTGLEWSQADNGSDISWAAAGKFCADKGAGWRLPSVSELLALYDKSGQINTTCGTGFTCKVSPLFQLTGPWAWSNEARNPMSSWIVILTNGNTDTYVAADPSKKRALCVLRP